MSRNITQLKRALTPEQKSDRRDTLLVTAKTLFMDAGYEGFSMGLLSKRAGVAKGTLYLYFGTKEEVLLSLYSLEFERFCSELTAGISSVMTDAEFISRIYETSVSDPLFLALHARLGTVIEQNISVDALIISKRYDLLEEAWDKKTNYLKDEITNSENSDDIEMKTIKNKLNFVLPLYE